MSIVNFYWKKSNYERLLQTASMHKSLNEKQFWNQYYLV